MAMPHPIPERALRRTIADLAAMNPEDAGAILAALEPAQRGTVEKLLSEYGAYFEGGPKPPLADGGNYDPSRLSSWLVQRLEGSPGFAMTAHARQELRDATARLYPIPASAASRPRMGLFGRMASVFSPGRPVS
jgi:hypothetical protein